MGYISQPTRLASTYPQDQPRHANLIVYVTPYTIFDIQLPSNLLKNDSKAKTKLSAASIYMVASHVYCRLNCFQHFLLNKINVVRAKMWYNGYYRFCNHLKLDLHMYSRSSDYGLRSMTLENVEVYN